MSEEARRRTRKRLKGNGDGGLNEKEMIGF